jgi:hypothetical protein
VMMLAGSLPPVPFMRTNLYQTRKQANETLGEAERRVKNATG